MLSKSKRHPVGCPKAVSTVFVLRCPMPFGAFKRADVARKQAASGRLPVGRFNALQRLFLRFQAL
eukprot:15467373-Alexandrium_andersonii.AAC.1